MADATANSHMPLLMLWDNTILFFCLACTCSCNKTWLVTTIILWLFTVLCTVFVAKPRPEREGYIHVRSPSNEFNTPTQVHVHVSHVYRTPCTCDNIPGYLPRNVEPPCLPPQPRYKYRTVLATWVPRTQSCTQTTWFSTNQI